MKMAIILLIAVCILSSCAEEPDLTRESSEVCDNERPNQIFPANGSNELGDCDSDAECTKGLNGRCIEEYSFNARFCSYDECFNDDGCGAGEACSCGKDQHRGYSAGRSDANSCVVSNCRINDDCGSQFCKPDHGEISSVGDRVIGYFCTTANDDCRNDSDCEGIGRARCTYYGAEKWFCNGGDG